MKIIARPAKILVSKEEWYLWMVQVTVCGAKGREATSCLFLLPGVQPLLWMKTFEGWRGIAQLLVSGSVAGAAV